MSRMVLVFGSTKIVDKRIAPYWSVTYSLEWQSAFSRNKVASF
jgi:hypothetical protein